MMKNKIFWLLLFLALSGSLFAQMDSYAYKRKLQSVQEKNWYAIKLPPSLVARTGDAINDLRVYRVSGDSTEIPYVLESLEEKNEKAEIPFAVINKGYDAKKGWYEITLRQKESNTVNHIELEFVEKNFDWRLAELEGSFDQQAWVVLSEGQRLVGIQNEDVRFHYTALNFHDSNYPYFRLRFSTESRPGSLDESETARLRSALTGNKLKWTPLDLVKATVCEVREIPAAYDTLGIAAWNITQDKRAKKTVVTISLKDRYAVRRLQMAVTTEKDYYRSVTAYVLRDSVKTANGYVEDWNVWQSSVFSSLEPNRIDGPAVRTKKIRLEISNYNDQPLAIHDAAVLGIPYQLKAELAPDRNYWLVYGKQRDELPKYDLVYFKDKIPSNLVTLSLGDEFKMAFSEELRGPWFGSRWWVWGVMAVVIVILGAMSLSMLKKTKNSG